jgi:hypothetical protein
MISIMSYGSSQLRCGGFLALPAVAVNICTRDTQSWAQLTLNVTALNIDRYQLFSFNAVTAVFLNLVTFGVTGLKRLLIR